MVMPPDRPKKLQQRTIKISAMTVVVGLLLFGFLVYVFQFAPSPLSTDKQRILAIVCALLAGLLGFYLTGDMGLTLTSAETRLGKVAVKATEGLAVFVFVLVWWLTPLSPITPDIYRVTLTVTDSQQRPVADARVTSSLGENGKQQGSVWQFDIPVSAKPSDKTVTFFAEKKAEFMSGRRELRLGNDFSPTLTIQMERDTSARAMGRVVDASDRVVNGAEVWVERYENEKTQTRDGYFDLPSHHGEAERVMVFVARPNFPIEQHWLAAGDPNAQIKLQR